MHPNIHSCRLSPPLYSVCDLFFVFAITFFIEFVVRDEAECGGVDAVAESAFIAWSIVEDMAEVGVGFGASDFGADHAMGMVCFLGEGVFCNGLGECGPATARVVFVG